MDFGNVSILKTHAKLYRAEKKLKKEKQKWKSKKKIKNLKTKKMVDNRKWKNCKWEICDHKFLNNEKQ